jgi:hypothetical protein
MIHRENSKADEMNERKERLRIYIHGVNFSHVTKRSLLYVQILVLKDD